MIENSPANAEGRRGAGSVPGSGISPGEGKDSPLQHPCLENLMDTAAWRATVPSVAKT